MFLTSTGVKSCLLRCRPTPVQKEYNKKSASTQPKAAVRRAGWRGGLLPSGPEDPESDDRKGCVRQPGGDDRGKSAGVPQRLGQLLHREVHERNAEADCKPYGLPAAAPDGGDGNRGQERSQRRNRLGRLAELRHEGT